MGSNGSIEIKTQRLDIYRDQASKLAMSSRLSKKLKKHYKEAGMSKITNNGSPVTYTDSRTNTESSSSERGRTKT